MYQQQSQERLPEIRRIFCGCCEGGTPDFRYREVVRNSEGTVIKYRTVDKSPGADLLMIRDFICKIEEDAEELWRHFCKMRSARNSRQLFDALKGIAKIIDKHL
jgi:hypothetical protein